MIFKTFSVSISSAILEMSPALLQGVMGMQALVDFSVIPKCVTLNDLQTRLKVFVLALAPEASASKRLPCLA